MKQEQLTNDSPHSCLACRHFDDVFPSPFCEKCDENFSQWELNSKESHWELNDRDRISEVDRKALDMWKKTFPPDYFKGV